jgi:hypothetical protein
MPMIHQNHGLFSWRIFELQEMSFISLPDLLATVQLSPCTDPDEHSSGKRRILFPGSGCVVERVDHDHQAIAAVAPDFTAIPNTRRLCA